MFNCQTVSTFYFIEEKIYNKTYIFTKKYFCYISGWNFQPQAQKTKKATLKKFQFFQKKIYFGMTADQVVN